MTILYRLIFGFYCLGWIIFSGFHPWNGKIKWFIYLTNWSYALVTLYFLGAGLASILHFRQQNAAASSYTVQLTTNEEHRSRDTEENAPLDTEDAEQQSMAWYHKALWVLYNISAPNAFLITVVYWGVLYTGYPTDMLDVSTHALNSVFMLTETCVGSVPVRVLHVIYPMAYSSLYLSMSAIYWACGGTNALGKSYIYTVLDYGSRPALSAGFCLVYVLVAVPLFHLLVFGFYKIRSFINHKFFN